MFLPSGTLRFAYSGDIGKLLMSRPMVETFGRFHTGCCSALDEAPDGIHRNYGASNSEVPIEVKNIGAVGVADIQIAQAIFYAPGNRIMQSMAYFMDAIGLGCPVARLTRR